MITSQWQRWVSCRWRCHPLSPLILWSLQWKWNFLKRTYCNFKFVKERKLVPWYWVQEGVAEGTCMKVWGYGMAPFGRGPPAWTNKGMNRAGRWYSHDTQWTFLGLHDWDLSVQSQHPGRERGLRQELAAWSHQAAFFHHMGKKPKWAREHEFEADSAEAGNKRSRTQASPVGPSRGFVR